MRRVRPGDSRRYPVGWHRQLYDHEWRVVQGRKGPIVNGEPDDCVLEWRCRHGLWRPVYMGLIALGADFFYEQEGHIKPRPHYRGGFYFLDFLHSAANNGHDAVVRSLNEQQELARRGRT